MLDCKDVRVMGGVVAGERQTTGVTSVRRERGEALGRYTSELVGELDCGG